MDSPRSADSVTYEPVLTLYGGGDPNFDLTINGETVPLNDKGLFSVERELKVGANTFTFEHKGKTATYTCLLYTSRPLLAAGGGGARPLRGGQGRRHRGVADGGLGPGGALFVCGEHLLPQLPLHPQPIEVGGRGRGRPKMTIV